MKLEGDGTWPGNKSPGLDEINSRVLKKLSSLAELLSDILEKSWKIG